MLKNYRNILGLILLACPSLNATVSVFEEKISDNEKELKLIITTQKPDIIYQEFLQVESDHPECSVSKYEATTEATDHFDKVFRAHKKGYQTPLTLKVTLKCQKKIPQDARIHVSYYLKSNGKIVHELINLASPVQAQKNNLKTSIDVEQQENNEVDTVAKCVTEYKQESKSWSWSEKVSSVLNQTNSIFVQLLFILLLGLLMSFTPCIYPMIPITMGILQAQSSPSLMRNFLLALSYTLGLATTFALLGLMAAFAGQALGVIMTKPLFIIPVVLLLLYLAGSMLGLYELRLPRFIQPNVKTRGGSYLASFLAGAIGGSVASPCLSPGLIMLLCIVSKLGSTLLGFVFLFVFGFGLGIPLLLIGTFSSSLSILPRAGMWMIEIKRIFGALLVITCWYFLANIVPWHILLWIIAASSAVLGLIYLYIAQKINEPWRSINRLLGVFLISVSIFATTKAFIATSIPSCPSPENHWITDYHCAREKALASSKRLFVDIGAPFCSICKALDKTLFVNKEVIDALERTVMVKIDGSANQNNGVIKQFDVKGFPTILLIDPVTDTVVKRWGSELYGVKAEQFIQDFNAAF